MRVKIIINWILALFAIAIFSFFAPLLTALGIKFIFDRLFPIESLLGLTGAAVCVYLVLFGLKLYIAAVDVYLIRLLPQRRTGAIITNVVAVAAFSYVYLVTSSVDDYLVYYVTTQLVFVVSVLYFGFREWDGVSEPKWIAMARDILDRPDTINTATVNGKLVPLTIETLKDDLDVLTRFSKSIERIPPDKVLSEKDLVCSSARIELAIVRVRLNPKASADLGKTLDGTEKLLSLFHQGNMTLQRALHEKVVPLRYAR